jgi:hypothetical protein
MGSKVANSLDWMKAELVHKGDVEYKRMHNESKPESEL